MNNRYPKSCVVWRGAILGGIAHAVMAAEDANCGFARSWINQDYLVQNEQGLYGTISLEGPLLLATFFDSKSMRSPYHDQRFDFNRFFEAPSANVEAAAPANTSVRTIMKSQRELINELVEAIIDNGHRRGIGALNDEQRVVFLVVHLETLTCMKGLAGFYHHCQGGAQAVAAADALQSIGADQSANLIRQANALFPDGQPPLDQAKLDDWMNRLTIWESQSTTQ